MSTSADAPSQAPDPDDAPQDQGSPEAEDVSWPAVAVGCLLFLAVPVALYLGLLWVLGLLPHPQLGWLHYGLGIAVVYLTAMAVSVMGESLIEDVVKFVLFAGAAWGLLALRGPAVGAVFLGAAVGAFTPLASRGVEWVGGLFGGDGDGSAEDGPRA